MGPFPVSDGGGEGQAPCVALSPGLWPMCISGADWWGGLHADSSGPRTAGSCTRLAPTPSVLALLVLLPGTCFFKGGWWLRPACLQQGLSVTRT